MIDTIAYWVVLLSIIIVCIGAVWGFDFEPKAKKRKQIG